VSGTGCNNNIVNPNKEEYQFKVKSFINNVFTETLNKALIKEMIYSGRKITIVKPELIRDKEWLLREFSREVNFVISRCQVYYHTTMCVKYFIKEVLKVDLNKCRT